jgi:hypothetical protein
MAQGKRNFRIAPAKPHIIGDPYLSSLIRELFDALASTLNTLFNNSNHVAECFIEIEVGRTPTLAGDAGK